MCDSPKHRRCAPTSGELSPDDTYILPRRQHHWPIWGLLWLVWPLALLVKSTLPVVAATIGPALQSLWLPLLLITIGLVLWQSDRES